MSDEIQAKDKILRKGWMDVWNVVAVHKGTAWIHHPVFDDALVPCNTLDKIAPTFEVGKRYRRKETPYQKRADLVVTVVAANNVGAVGWYADGDPWKRHHGDRQNWEEIAAREAIEDGA